MFGLVIVVVLVSTVIVGTVLGRRYRVGPPVLLIVLGALLGLIPAFGGVRINGEMVLLLFLPAILYWESMNTSFREIRANLRVIVFLSIALVIATAVAVSWTARALGMESHAAAVLGAVLSPTDAAAVAGLAKRLPRRTLTVLRAESIINDGTALVLFIVTVHVAVGGAAIGPIDLVVRFIGSYLGGIAAGLLVGGLVTLLRRGIDAPLEEGALSVLTPFAAFLLAQSIHCSGVVAVMVSALVLAYSGPVVIRARSRLQAYAFWDIATFLINGSLWVFVGVQIPGALRGISNVGGGLHHAAFITLAITGVIIVSRIFWEEFTRPDPRTEHAAHQGWPHNQGHHDPGFHRGPRGTGTRVPDRHDHRQRTGQQHRPGPLPAGHRASGQTGVDRQRKQQRRHLQRRHQHHRPQR